MMPGDGGEDQVFASHKLHQLKNVFFPGKIPKNTVPAYMAAFQVCMNPQALNEITIGNYPRKVVEYLAMGKPVIATKTGTMELFKDHAFLCENVEDYEIAVDKALKDISPEKDLERIRFAKSHSWKNNVDLIYSRIKENIN